jgi:hypothetical protein
MSRSVNQKTAKYALYAVLAVLIYVGPPQRKSDVSPSPSGPADRVIAVYESLNQSVIEASVMSGSTVQAIDKAGKWRQYDKNKIPEAMKTILAPVVEKCGIPCVCMIQENAVIAACKFPNSDADLSVFVKKNGGF